MCPCWPRGERLVGRLLTALLTTLLTAPLCGIAQAQEVVLLELKINGRATARVEEFLLHGGRTLAPRALWRELGVRDGGASPADEMVSLAQLPGVKAQLDMDRRTLALDLPPDPSSLTVIDRGMPPGETPLDHGSGALLNYDISHQRQGGSTRSAGLLAARWFTAAGVLEDAHLLSSGPGARHLRLDTVFTSVDTQRLERVRVGDLVTGGLGWTRALRVAGVQLATDFAIRPGLVTMPTPQLGGSVAVPSTVDVLVNGVRQLSAAVEPGRFEVRQLPTVNGAGEVAVVVRDALGREAVQNLSFYASSQLLTPGLSAYAFDAGRIRRDYATASDRYQGRAATATWRHGWSPSVTLEGHAEAGAGSSVIGAGGVTTLGARGLASGSLACSRSAGRSGVLGALTLERQTAAVSLQLALQASSADYRDVASGAGSAPLRHSARVGMGWQMGAAGQVGLAAVDQRSGSADPHQRSGSAGLGRSSGPAGPLAASHTRLLTATYSRQLPQGMAVFVNGYRGVNRDAASAAGTTGSSSGRTSSHGVSVGVSIPFGPRSTASALWSHDRGGSRVSASASQASTATGDWGWRVQGDRSSAGNLPSRALAQVSYLAAQARVTAEAEQLGGRPALRVGAQGALLVLGGQLHASQPVSDSVAVVEVDGQPGVAVFHQNRLVGRTDARGRIVVPGLLSFQANKLAIDGLDLPLDAEAETLQRDVRPADRSGVHVRFAIERRQAALIELLDAGGQPLPIGARVRLGDDAAASTVVGYGGQAYLQQLRADNRLTVEWAGQRCEARFAWAASPDTTARPAAVRCQ